MDMSERGWLVELDNKLTFGTCADSRLVTVTFTDPAARRFKRQGDADFERQQLESRFHWMKGRLTIQEHMWSESGAALRSKEER